MQENTVKKIKIPLLIERYTDIKIFISIYLSIYAQEREAKQEMKHF